MPWTNLSRESRLREIANALYLADVDLREIANEYEDGLPVGHPLNSAIQSVKAAQRSCLAAADREPLQDAPR